MHCNATFLNSFIVSVISWPSHHLWHCSQLPVILRHQLVCPCVHGPDPKELPDQPSNPTWKQECSKIQTSGYIETHKSIQFPGTRSGKQLAVSPYLLLAVLDLEAPTAMRSSQGLCCLICLLWSPLLKIIQKYWKSIKDYRDQRKVRLMPHSILILKPSLCAKIPFAAFYGIPCVAFPLPTNQQI